MQGKPVVEPIDRNILTTEDKKTSFEAVTLIKEKYD